MCWSVRRALAASVIIASTVLSAGVAVTAAAVHRKAPKVQVAFAFFGCNRIDAKDVEEARAANPSTANLPQLRQNVADIAALAPDYLFFGGDLVMGYADDKGEGLQQQLGAWVDVVKTLPRSPKTRFVVIAGNHEMNRKSGELKLPNAANDGVWTKFVKANGLAPSDAKGPDQNSSPRDHLIDDQRALSFSFNRGPVHFVVLNTDTRVSTKDAQTGETKIGMIPVHWLSVDLDAAEKNEKIKAVIVMGHRNVVDPDSAKGDAPIDPECAVPMIKALQSHAKVRAYVCAHVHAFDITTIGDSGLRQVTFGNGGSKLEKGWNPPRGRTFGFGYFKVYEDGTVGVIPYLRPEPKDYMDARPEEVPPAKPETELIVPTR